tara:strand:+ start:409 stop:726 length:318 start_codon:yes stop_codon:yes gene_type:complete
MRREAAAVPTMAEMLARTPEIETPSYAVLAAHEAEGWEVRSQRVHGMSMSMSMPMPMSMFMSMCTAMCTAMHSHAHAVPRSAEGFRRGGRCGGTSTSQSPLTADC